MTVSRSLFRIEPRGKLPLYEKIQRNLRELIANDVLKSGDAVPSEWELAGLYGVSRLTVRRALEDLVRQNWLERRRGVGTFVTKPAIASIAPSKLSFTEQMLAIGRRPSSRLLLCHTVPAQGKVASSLNLREGEPIVEIARVRLADGIPILLETSYLSQTRFPKPLDESRLANESLYALLKEYYQVSITGLDQTLKSVLVGGSEAQHLQVQPGSPAIFSETVAYSAEGESVEYSWSVSSGEKSEFYFRFRRGEVLG